MSGVSKVYVLGGYQTDFARNWVREGFETADLMREVLQGGLEATGIPAAAIEVAHVGNFVAELFVGQGQLGGLLAEVEPALNGVPVSRHEAACASGSMAILAAMADIESGRYQTACVIGMEVMRNVPGELAAQHLGAAAWVGHEAQSARYCWPHMFNQLSQEYESRYGLDYQHVAAIAETNYKNAKRNHNAQTRNWSFQPESFSAQDELNPVIEGLVRRNDCGQVSDGAAMVVLASEKQAAQYAAEKGISLDTIPCIKGWGHRTARLSYAGKIQDSANESLVFPYVNATIKDAFKRASIADVFELDAIETHDCFAITEYMAIDHFGMTAPGESWKAVEAGWHEMGGRLPINPSGGLIGCGHPVGATGVRMLLDCYKQTASRAGEYQVENAKNVAMLNIGGSTTTTACFVVGV